MNGIFDVHILTVSLFKELFSSAATPTESSSFPTIESTGGFNLEDLRSVLFIIASNNHTNAERSYSTWLGILLEQVCYLFAKHKWCDAILVFSMIHLDIFSSLEKDCVEVRTNTSISNSKVGRNLFNFVDGWFIN